MAKLTEMPHPVSDRIMTMRIPLTKDQNATIVSAYAPIMTNPEENKDIFYSQLKGTLRNIPSTDKLLLIGDLQGYEKKMTSGPQPWASMGSGNVIPTVSFYWHYALSSI